MCSALWTEWQQLQVTAFPILFHVTSVLALHWGTPNKKSLSTPCLFCCSTILSNLSLQSGGGLHLQRLCCSCLLHLSCGSRAVQAQRITCSSADDLIICGASLPSVLPAKGSAGAQEGWGNSCLGNTLPADVACFTDKRQSLAAIFLFLTSLVHSGWGNHTKKKKIPGSKWPFCVASFVGRSDCSSGCVENHVRATAVGCIPRMNFCEMSVSNFMELRRFRKLRFNASKEAKHHGLSCCVISIYNRVEVVRRLRQIRKDKSTNDRVPWRPSKHCRSSGKKGSQHAYTTAYMTILLKKERRSRMCAYETNRLHCELAMLLFLWLFGVPSIFAIL